LTSARQGRTKKEVFDLNQVLEALLDVEIGSFSRNAQISITLELAKEPLFVLASESHIQRALSNLLRNAIEAIDPPGRVLIQTGSTRLSEPLMGYETIEPGDYVTISVSDTGRGIATAELGRLFEPFFTKKPVGETSGSGLGLAIVHGVVKEHGGFVNVESVLGRGTTFTLYFGKAAPSAFVHEAQRQPSSMPSALNVLVIDDDPMQLRTAQRILSRRGHRVTAIASGREALARMQTLQAHADLKSPYDLIMLDMLLNEADDGLTLSERICERFPNQKCIIVSGHAPSERGLLAVERGLTWLCKPYPAEQLHNTVEPSARQRDPPSGVGHSQATASVGVQRNTGT
jgi:CheY-like chemotaxis protein